MGRAGSGKVGKGRVKEEIRQGRVGQGTLRKERRRRVGKGGRVWSQSKAKNTEAMANQVGNKELRTVGDWDEGNLSNSRASKVQTPQKNVIQPKPPTSPKKKHLLSPQYINTCSESS